MLVVLVSMTANERKLLYVNCFLNIIFVAKETAFLFFIGHIYRALVVLVSYNSNPNYSEIKKALHVRITYDCKNFDLTFHMNL